jgi:hypothetical protein
MILFATYLGSLFGLQVLIWRVTQIRAYRFLLTCGAVVVAAGMTVAVLAIVMSLLRPSDANHWVVRGGSPCGLTTFIVLPTIAAITISLRRGTSSHIDSAVKYSKLGRAGTRAVGEFKSTCSELVEVLGRLELLRQQPTDMSSIATEVRDQAICELERESEGLLQQIGAVLETGGLELIAELDRAAKETLVAPPASPSAFNRAASAAADAYSRIRAAASQRVQHGVFNLAEAVLELRLDLAHLRAVTRDRGGSIQMQPVVSRRIAVEIAKRPQATEDLRRSIGKDLLSREAMLDKAVAGFCSGASPELVRDLENSVNRLSLPAGAARCAESEDCLHQFKLDLRGRIQRHTSVRESKGDPAQQRIGWIVVGSFALLVGLVVSLIAFLDKSDGSKQRASDSSSAIVRGDQASRNEASQRSRPPVPIRPDRGSIGEAGAMGASVDSTERSDSAREKAAVDLAFPKVVVDASVWMKGQTIVAHGFEILPRRPSFTNLQTVGQLPKCRPPVVNLFFGRAGRCIRAVIRTSSGDADIDRTLEHGLYFWRATGKQIDELGDRGVVSMTFELLW